MTAAKSGDGQAAAKIAGVANLTELSLAGFYGRYQSNYSLHLFIEDNG